MIANVAVSVEVGLTVIALNAIIQQLVRFWERVVKQIVKLSAHKRYIRIVLEDTQTKICAAAFMTANALLLIQTFS